MKAILILTVISRAIVIENTTMVMCESTRDNLYFLRCYLYKGSRSTEVSRGSGWAFYSELRPWSQAPLESLDPGPAKSKMPPEGRQGDNSHWSQVPNEVTNFFNNSVVSK